MADYINDELIESKLIQLFMQGDLRSSLSHWDLERRADGGVNLPLRSRLDDLHAIEQTQAE